MKKETIELKNIAKLNIKKGDILAIKSGVFNEEMVREVCKLFKCKVIILPSLNQIGIIKFNENIKKNIKNK